MAWIKDHQWDRLVAVMQLTAHHLSELRQEIRKMADQMKDAMDGLTRAVQLNGDRTQAAITAFQGIAQQIHAAADNDDSNAVHALADQINAQSQTLADAISANTPGGTTTFSSEPLTGTQTPAPNPAHPGSIPPPPPAPATSGMGGSGAGQATTPATSAPADQLSDTGSGDANATGPADTDTGTAPEAGPGSEQTAETPQAGF